VLTQAHCECEALQLNAPRRLRQASIAEAWRRNSSWEWSTESRDAGERLRFVTLANKSASNETRQRIALGALNGVARRLATRAAAPSFQSA
jgi:hypothetical protein